MERGHSNNRGNRGGGRRNGGRGGGGSGGGGFGRGGPRPSHQNYSNSNNNDDGGGGGGGFGRGGSRPSHQNYSNSNNNDDGGGGGGGFGRGGSRPSHQNYSNSNNNDDGGGGGSGYVRGGPRPSHQNYSNNNDDGGGGGSGYVRGGPRPSHQNYSNNNEDGGGGDNQPPPTRSTNNHNDRYSNHYNSNIESNGSRPHHHSAHSNSSHNHNHNSNNNQNRTRSNDHHNSESYNERGSENNRRSNNNSNNKPVVKSQSIVVNDPYWDAYMQLKKEPRKSSSAKVDEEEDEDDIEEFSKSSGNQCSICLLYRPAISREEINALTPCNHQFCYECALRLIYISGSDECPICRQKFDKIIFSHQPTVDFDLFENVNYLLAISKIQTPETNEESVAEGAVESTDSQKPAPLPPLPAMPKLPVNLNQYGIIFFDDPKIKDSIIKLISFTCRHCNKFSVESDFKDKHFYRRYSYHLFNYHKRSICELCITNLKLFPVEFKDYSEQEMKGHCKKGELICDSLVRHQTCDLCPGTCNFFNLDSLLAHCKQEHISCYVCDPRSQSIFFLDQDSLNEHLINVHIVCQLCRVSGQIISFLTEFELKRHAQIDHKADKFHLAQLIAESTPCNFSENTSESQIVTRREVFDEMDNLLRSRFQNSPIVVQSLDPTKENYQLNFPSIDGKAFNEKEVVVFPGNNNQFLNNSGSPVSYDSNFPTLGGKNVSKSKMAIKTAVKPPKAAAATFIKPKQSLSKPNLTVSDFLKTSDSKTKSKSAKAKPRPVQDSDDDDEPGPSFDSVPYSDRSGMKYESNVVVQRPSAIKFIDAPVAAAPAPAQPSNNNKLLRNWDTETSEAFPALGPTSSTISATSALPKGRNFTNKTNRSQNKMSGSQWSNVVATAKQEEAKVKSKAQQQAKSDSKPPVPESLALKDESTFPTLDTLSLNGKSNNGPVWGSRKPLASTIAKTGLPSQDFGQFKLVESKKKSKPSKVTKIDNGVFDSNPSSSNATSSQKGASKKSNSIPAKFEFIPYIDLQHRNVDLIDRVRRMMAEKGNNPNQGDNGPGLNREDSVQFKSFKLLSSKYRKSQISVEDYYQDCLNVLKPQDLNVIIYDLITLLPNIEKQNELYRIHLDRLKLNGALPKRLPLYRCPTCTQLMMNSDKQFHINQHQ